MIIQEIHALYDQKQKDQKKVDILKRTIQLITKAKENLAKASLTAMRSGISSQVSPCSQGSMTSITSFHGHLS